MLPWAESGTGQADSTTQQNIAGDIAIWNSLCLFLFLARIFDFVFQVTCAVNIPEQNDLILNRMMTDPA